MQSRSFAIHLPQCANRIVQQDHQNWKANKPLYKQISRLIVWCRKTPPVPTNLTRLDPFDTKLFGQIDATLKNIGYDQPDQGPQGSKRQFNMMINDSSDDDEVEFDVVKRMRTDPPDQNLVRSSNLWDIHEGVAGVNIKLVR